MGLEDKGRGGGRVNRKKCQYYAHMNTKMKRKVRKEKEQLLHLNKILREDAGKAKKKRNRSEKKTGRTTSRKAIKTIKWLSPS